MLNFQDAEIDVVNCLIEFDTAIAYKIACRSRYKIEAMNYFFLGSYCLRRRLYPFTSQIFLLYL